MVRFESLDRYLLGEPVSKADAVAAALAERSDAPAAAPFYRALEAIGVRAADESLIALRIVLAGLEPSDERVRRVRAWSALARAAATGDVAAIRKSLKRDAAALPVALDVNDLARVRECARSEFARELAGA